MTERSPDMTKVIVEYLLKTGLYATRDETLVLASLTVVRALLRVNSAGD